MKTRTILSVAVAFAMLSMAFSSVMAGESLTVYGFETSGVNDGAAVEAWNTLRSLEIVTDQLGAGGQSATATMYMYNPGNYATNWADGDTDRRVAAWTNGDRGYAGASELTLVSGAGSQQSDITVSEMVMPYQAAAYVPGSFTMSVAWPDPADPLIAGYLVYRSTDNSSWALVDGTTGFLAGNWFSAVCNLERATAWNSGLTFTDNTIPAEGVNYYYALRYVYAGDGTYGVPTNYHSSTGLNNPDGTFVPVYGCGSPPMPAIGGNTAPVVSAFAVPAGPLLAGDHTAETVTLGATIDDSVNEGDIIAGAEINVNGEGWVAMTPVTALDTATEDFTYVYTAPVGYYPTGAINYDVRGSDVVGGPGATSTDSFTIVDTTAPTAAFTSAPGATAYIGNPIPFIASYEDFTALDFAVASSSFNYSVNNGSWTDVAWTNDSFAWNSFSNFISYTLATGGFVATDNIDYVGVVRDSAGNPTIFGAGTVIMMDAPPGVQDPYPVYGYVFLYDGTNAGGYAPMTSAGGAAVTVTWINTTTAAASSIVTATNAAGQYSVDLLNYTDGATVEVSATFEAPYNNNGYNYTTIAVGGGGSMQEVVCGVPYAVNITTPVNNAVVTASVPFPATYNVYDRDWTLCQGYFTYAADGPMEWYSGDALFVPPALRTFDGTADATPGTQTDTLTMLTGGLQWINISEGGPAPTPDGPLYLTPWGNIQTSINFALVDNFLDDWDNITLNVLSGGFTWELVQGWNMVSAPQDASAMYGTNGIFDADDALNHCFDYTQDANMAMADRTGPSAYTTNDYGIGEPGAFAIDGVHGYWVYCAAVPVNGIVPFNATNYTSLGTMSVAAGAGWNLLGFAHNYTLAGWTTAPTASMFTDGTVDVDLTVGGAAGAKIIVTDWNQGSQWYHSYVASTTFPGMAAHNWAWDFAYDPANPGNAYFLYVTAGVTVDFDVNF